MLRAQPAPGGVRGGMIVWLDASSIAQPSGSTIQSWSERESGWVASQPVVEQQPILSEQRWNGYSTVVFDGIDDHLALPEGVLQGAFGDFELFIVANHEMRGRTLLGNDGSDSTGFQIGDGWIKAGSSLLQSDDTLSSGPALYHFGAAQGRLATQRNARVTRVDSIQTWIGLADPLYLGRPGSIDSLYFQGELAELILYDRTLAFEEVLRIQAYLAAKYGLTISQQYVASDGGEVWSQSGHPDHMYDVGVIGRDDSSAFFQDLARSIEPGSILSVSHLGSLKNLDFWAWASDSGPLTEKSDTLKGVVLEQLNRTWHIHRRRTAGDVRISIDLSAAAITGTMLSDFWLVLDTDDDLGNGVRSVYPATSFQQGQVDFEQVRLESEDIMSLVTSNPAGDVLNVSTEGSGIPSSTRLDVVFPNPFRGRSEIRFALGAPGNVHLEVYDVQGRLVDTLIASSLVAGEHKYIHDASNLASGLYIYRLTTEDGVRTRSVALVK